VTAVAVGRTHGVADVTTHPCQPVVELVSNRCPADEPAVDLGDEKRRRHNPLGHANALADRLDRVEVFRPTR